MGRRHERVERRACRALRALGPSSDLDVAALTLEETERPSAGSRPAWLVRDRSGKRYFFKSSPPEHVAAEILAGEVRGLGQRPTLMVQACELDLPGVGPTRGMIQALLETSGARLPTDPLAWSPLQREVMLREHPWEWLLANLDTHIDQYVLFGAQQMPLNIDWDHALVDLAIERLDRFTKRHPAVAPVRNALYDAYARGDVALGFQGLRREVRKIARLDDRALESAMVRWARLAGVGAATARETTAALVRRKRDIGRTFGGFLRDLRHERLSRRLSGGRALPLRERLRIAAQDAWQRLLIDTLHDRAVLPSLRAYRRIVAARERLFGRR